MQGKKRILGSYTDQIHFATDGNEDNDDDDDKNMMLIVLDVMMTAWLQYLFLCRSETPPLQPQACHLQTQEG